MWLPALLTWLHWGFTLQEEDITEAVGNQEYTFYLSQRANKTVSFVLFNFTFKFKKKKSDWCDINQYAIWPKTIIKLINIVSFVKRKASEAK